MSSYCAFWRAMVLLCSLVSILLCPIVSSGILCCAMAFHDATLTHDSEGNWVALYSGNRVGGTAAVVATVHSLNALQYQVVAIDKHPSITALPHCHSLPHTSGKYSLLEIRASRHLLTCDITDVRRQAVSIDAVLSKLYWMTKKIHLLFKYIL